MGFKPGVSGNPGGRAKARYDLQKLARKQTRASIKRLIEIRDQNENLSAASRAAEILLDRGWGKAESASTMMFNIEAAETGAMPTQIKVSFVEGQEWPDEPRLLPDVRSPHLPNGRRN
jgi:hypothetical protein